MKKMNININIIKIYEKDERKRCQYCDRLAPPYEVRSNSL